MPQLERLARARYRLYLRLGGVLRVVGRTSIRRRLRFVLHPQDTSPLFAGVQIWLGRSFGRMVTGNDRLAERLHIQRSLLSERAATPSIVRALLRARRGMLVTTGVLLALALGLDALIHHFGRDVLDALPGHNALTDTFNRPSRATLHEALIATAAATGTILGLVLSVSLIVFQATAERYERPRIVAFLLRERVGGAVVSLLTVSFLYSIGLLLLSDTLADVTPYAATTFAVALGGAGVAALVGYRLHALSGYLPGRLFESLAREIVQQLLRAQSPHAGRSVQAHAHRIVIEDLATLEELVRRVSREADFTTLGTGVESIEGVLTTYLRLKRRFDANSLWFPRRQIRMSGDPAYSIEDTITGQGLLAVTDSHPNTDWLELRLLDIARLARDEIPVVAIEAWEALLAFYGRSWQTAWYAQEVDVADRILADVEALTSANGLAGNPNAIQRITELAWVVVESAAQGFTTTAEGIVDASPWESASAQQGLPRLASEQAAVLGRKIKLEIAMAGRVKTPRDWMVADVAREWSPIEHEHRDRGVERGFQLALTVAEAAIAQTSQAAPAAVEMLLRTLVRTLEREVPLPVESDLIRMIDAALALADGDDYGHLQDTLFTATRRFAEEGHWEQNWRLLTIALASALPRDRARAGSDQGRAVVAWMNGLFLLAHSYAWAEFKGEPRGFDKVATLLPLIAPLDGLIQIVGNHFASTLLVPFNESVKYGSWFQPLRTAVYELPDRYERDGGIGYRLVKEHPAEMFQVDDMLGFDGDAAVEHLVHRLEATRAETIGRLATLLDARRRAS